ncbi:hypothetical protein P3T22_006118 [Paraburkholderia sp. GAS348]
MQWLCQAPSIAYCTVIFAATHLAAPCLTSRLIRIRYAVGLAFMHCGGIYPFARWVARVIGPRPAALCNVARSNVPMLRVTKQRSQPLPNVSQA